MRILFKIIMLSTLLVLTLGACQADASAPALRIVSPKSGERVRGPKVRVEVQPVNLKLFDGNRPHVDGEGHVHVFIDTPANTIQPGKLIPLDQPARYVHFGKEPLTWRDIELPTGNHRISVVYANNEHLAQASPAPVTVEFIVE